MTFNQPPASKKKFRVIWVLVGIIALAIFLAAGGFTYAATQEAHDPFCASCHTQPETTFVQRSTAAQAVDLASYHTAHNTRCIDCHSGPGVWGRLQAELLGAGNTVAWYTNAAVQPAQLTVPIEDANCLKCHQDVTQRGYQPKQKVNITGAGMEEEEEAGGNHWHELLARWQSLTPQAGTCTSCHPGHSTEGAAQTGFQNDQTTRAECQACHRVMGDD